MRLLLLSTLSILLLACSAPFTMAEAVSSNSSNLDAGDQDALEIASQVERVEAGAEVEESGAEEASAEAEAEAQAVDASSEREVDVHLEASTPEASEAASEASTPKVEAGPVEAEAAPPAEASPAPGSCPSPYTTAQPYCPTGCACAEQSVPEHVALVFLSTCSSGVTALDTPAPCQACGTYTCACVMGNLPSGHVCGSSQPTCNDSTDAPTLVCP